MPFYKTGYDSVDAALQQQEQRDAEYKARGGNIFDFFLRGTDETRSVIFLTGAQDGGDVPIIEQHNLKLNGKWGNTFTCLKTIGESCPLCDAGDKPQTVGFYLIIDRTASPSKKDPSKVYKDQLRVFPAKLRALKQLKKIALKNQHGLKGIEFDVSKTDGNSPSCGDSFIQNAAHDGATIKTLLGGKKLSEALASENVVAFWDKRLQPKPKADLVVLVSNKQTGTTAGTSGLAAEADVSFDD